VSVNLRVSVAFLSVLVIVVGGLLIWVAATSVADPLQSLRESLTEVEQGHLDVAVPVNDAGEVGRLQSGFNQMVTGLRERRHLEDLFGRHVGAEVARFALDEEAGLKAQMREASALFVDMIGSTALSARIPPAETVAMLNDLFDVTVRVVTDCGGWVNKFEGDGALCVFGTPGQQADHADRVLAAARALRAEVVALQDRWPVLDTGIGVSSGTVLAGNVGAEERYEYTVIGDPVNEAARLTDESKRLDARVLASEASIRRAGEDEAAHWEVVGELALRGRDQPTCAYRPKDLVRSSAGSAR
jgi:adenylate cyclase